MMKGHNSSAILEAFVADLGFDTMSWTSYRGLFDNALYGIETLNPVSKPDTRLSNQDAEVLRKLEDIVMMEEMEMTEEIVSYIAKFHSNIRHVCFVLLLLLYYSSLD